MFNEEEVISVHHWNERLFSFRTTRAPTFRFSNGHFTMVGLPVDGKPLLRAYSIASANHQPYLEFFSIKVPNGPLTSRLQHLQVGERVLVGRKPTGTLVGTYLKPGRHLYLLGTGTGLAPFLSVIGDPEALESFEKIVLVHGVREIADLAYREAIETELPQDPDLGELVRDKLVYLPTVTREPFEQQGRITDWLASGGLADAAGLPPVTADDDRFMVCGSPAFVADVRALLESRGFVEGNTQVPGDYVVERAFVDR